MTDRHEVEAAVQAEVSRTTPRSVVESSPTETAWRRSIASRAGAVLEAAGVTFRTDEGVKYTESAGREHYIPGDDFPFAVPDTDEKRDAPKDSHGGDQRAVSVRLYRLIDKEAAGGKDHLSSQPFLLAPAGQPDIPYATIHPTGTIHFADAYADSNDPSLSEQVERLIMEIGADTEDMIRDKKERRRILRKRGLIAVVAGALSLVAARGIPALLEWNEAHQEAERARLEAAAQAEDEAQEQARLRAEEAIEAFDLAYDVESDSVVPADVAGIAVSSEQFHGVDVPGYYDTEMVGEELVQNLDEPRSFDVSGMEVGDGRVFSGVEISPDQEFEVVHDGGSSVGLVVHFDSHGDRIVVHHTGTIGSQNSANYSPADPSVIVVQISDNS